MNLVHWARKAARFVVHLGAIVLLLAILGMSAYVAATRATDDAMSAVVRDTGMGKSVPMGSIIIMPDRREYEVGDVVAYYTDPNVDGITAPFGADTVTRRVIQYGYPPFEKDGVIWIRAQGDALPDPEPGWIRSGRVLGGMESNVPLLGFVWWFGPVSIAAVTLLLLAVIYATRPSGFGWVTQLVVGIGVLAVVLVLVPAALGALRIPGCGSDLWAHCELFGIQSRIRWLLSLLLIGLTLYGALVVWWIRAGRQWTLRWQEV